MIDIGHYQPIIKPSLTSGSSMFLKHSRKELSPPKKKGTTLVNRQIWKHC